MKLGAPRFLTRSAHARRRAVLALIPLLMASHGCYAYHATELPQLTAGEQVRVELGAEGQRTTVPGTASMLGRPRFEGRFSRLTEDSVIVAVWIGEAYAGTPFEASYQDVMLPRAEVFRVEHRQLDKVRTGLVTAGAVAVIVYLIDSVGVFDIFPSRGPGTPPEPPEIFISR
jgi:hypothetical protein